jgi:hypothetical protein
MPAPRIPRQVMAGKRRKNERVDHKHADFIRGLPCLCCGRAAPNEQAHVRLGTDGGMGLRPSDRYSVPLCAWCHRLAPRAQHQIGEPEFYSLLGIDGGQVAERLYRISGDQAQGVRAIDRARASARLAGHRFNPMEAAA